MISPLEHDGNGVSYSKIQTTDGVNAIDVDVDDLGIVQFSVVDNNGVLTKHDDITWIFTSNVNFRGEIVLEYKISDGYELSDARANINVKVSDNLAINSGFEQGNQAFQTDYQILTQARCHDTLAIVDTPPNGALGVGDFGKFLMVDILLWVRLKLFGNKKLS